MNVYFIRIDTKIHVKSRKNDLLNKMKVKKIFEMINFVTFLGEKQRLFK